MALNRAANRIGSGKVLGSGSLPGPAAKSPLARNAISFRIQLAGDPPSAWLAWRATVQEVTTQVANPHSPVRR
ncbi:MAG TPA: hypothetical protein VMA72_20855 [Streptosporangiaceae bacterium]|nr:hypothetical protein [Streptosporangiaceae bacterium]